MDKKIYLTVSGFNIEIYLTKASNNVFQDKIKKEIYYSCKEFINVHKPEKIDYVIKFLETPQIPSFTKKRIFYISLYAEKTKTIETYYQINSTLFLVILKYILVKLLGNKGFFLHGSASLINNKANLFLGKPGSGKSTIISLINKKYQSLADDILILRKEHGQYLVYQTPFLEKIFLTKKSTPYYLGKIFFLKKRKFVKIIKISDKNLIFQKITAQLFTERKLVKKQILALFEFTQKTKDFYYFFFKKDENLVTNLFLNSY